MRALPAALVLFALSSLPAPGYAQATDRTVVWLRAPSEFDAYRGPAVGRGTETGNHTLAFRESDDGRSATVEVTLMGESYHVCSWGGEATRHDPEAYIARLEGACELLFVVTDERIEFSPTDHCDRGEGHDWCGALGHWHEATFPRTDDDPRACTRRRVTESQETLPMCRVNLGEPSVVAAADGFELETREWWTPETSGTAWHVSAPLPSELSLSSSGEGAVDFGGLLPSSGNTWAAINGGFYATDGSPLGLVVADGQVENPHARRGGSGVLVVDDEGPRIVHRDAYEPGATHALQSIDRVVDRGRNLVRRVEGADIAARSAVVISDTHIHLVVVAGQSSISGDWPERTLRLTGADGLTLWQFAEYLRLSVDAQEALNLDGGGSSQLAASIDGVQVRIRGVSDTPNAVVLRPTEPGER